MPPTPQPAPHPPDKDKPQPRLRPKVAGAWIIGLFILLFAAFAAQRFSSDREEIDFTSFDAQVRAHNVKSIDVYGSVAYGEFVEPPLLQPSAEEAKTASKDGKTATDQPRRASKEFWVTLPGENVDPEFVRQWREAGVKSIAFHKPKNYSDLLLLVWLGLLDVSRHRRLGHGSPRSRPDAGRRDVARRAAEPGSALFDRGAAGDVQRRRRSQQCEEGPAGDCRVPARSDQVSQAGRSGAEGRAA